MVVVVVVVIVIVAMYETELSPKSLTWDDLIESGNLQPVSSLLDTGLEFHGR